jgi:hypothetical protein
MENSKTKSKHEILAFKKKLTDLSSNLEKSINTWLNIKKIHNSILSIQECSQLNLQEIEIVEEIILLLSLIQLIYYLYNKPLYSKELKIITMKLVEKIFFLSSSNNSFTSNTKKQENKSLPKAKSFNKLQKIEDINVKLSKNKTEVIALDFYTIIVAFAKKIFFKQYPEAYHILNQLSVLCSDNSKLINENITLENNIKDKVYYNFNFIKESYINTITFSIKNPKESNNYFTFGNNKSSKQLSLFELLPQSPFLAKKLQEDNKLVLVLDLDECLVHSFKGDIALCCFARPGVIKFLTELKSMYEIGIFTSSAQDYADLIIDNISKSLFDFRLYRQHITDSKNNKYKDLSKIGRDMNKLIFIDNHPLNFELQPENSFYINTWESDLFDKQFIGLEKVLKGIYNEYQYFNYNNSFDVRKIITSIKQQISNKYIETSCNPYDKIHLFS